MKNSATEPNKDIHNHDVFIEAWKVDVIKLQVNKSGLPQHEIEDAIQSIIICLRDKPIDKDKYNQQQQIAIFSKCVKYKIKHIKRAKAIYHKHMTKLKETNTQTQSYNTHPIIEVLDVIELLSEQEQSICRCLMHGYSKNKTAELLGLSNYQLNIIINKLKYALSSLV